MPRYSFRIIGKGPQADSEGMEFPSPDTARAAAVITLGQMIKDDPAFILTGQWLTVEVYDESGAVMASVVVSAI